MTFRISETAMAARRQHELLNGKTTEIDTDHVCRVANAMRTFRRENINEPLDRLWERLALVAVQTE